MKVAGCSWGPDGGAGAVLQRAGGDGSTIQVRCGLRCWPARPSPQAVFTDLLTARAEVTLLDAAELLVGQLVRQASAQEGGGRWKRVRLSEADTVLKNDSPWVLNVDDWIASINLTLPVLTLPSGPEGQRLHEEMSAYGRRVEGPLGAGPPQRGRLLTAFGLAAYWLCKYPPADLRPIEEVEHEELWYGERGWSMWSMLRW